MEWTVVAITKRVINFLSADTPPFSRSPKLFRFLLLYSESGRCLPSLKLMAEHYDGVRLI
jgi:hypothetical protein